MIKRSKQIDVMISPFNFPSCDIVFVCSVGNGVLDN